MHAKANADQWVCPLASSDHLTVAPAGRALENFKTYLSHPNACVQTFMRLWRRKTRSNTRWNGCQSKEQTQGETKTSWHYDVTVWYVACTCTSAVCASAAEGPEPGAASSCVSHVARESRYSCTASVLERPSSSATAALASAADLQDTSGQSDEPDF